MIPHPIQMEAAAEAVAPAATPSLTTALLIKLSARQFFPRRSLSRPHSKRTRIFPKPIRSAVPGHHPRSTSLTAAALQVTFHTLGACKLGISRYPDFEYDAEGGSGIASCSSGSAPLEASFDVGSLQIPPLTSATTRFLGLPLPPPLRIDIAPELLDGTIDTVTGKVELVFKAKFWFSVGSIYKAPAMLVSTRLTTEESRGKMRGGKGERMDEEGRCCLVGVASVDPIGDVLMDSFLGLPTECLAILNAKIGISPDAAV